MSVFKRLRYLSPGFRRAEERDMREELSSLAAMAEPGELGNLTLAAERRREVWGWTWLEQWVLDVRHAARTLRHNPDVHGGRAADARDRNRRQRGCLQRRQQRAAEAAALSEGGGTGGAPAGRSGRCRTGEFYRRPPPLALHVFHLRRAKPDVSIAWACGSPARRTSRAWPSRNKSARCTSATACFRRSTFPPQAGRWLLAADQIPHGAGRRLRRGLSDTVMLSYGYWQRHFGGDRSAIGRTITVDSRPRKSSA